MPFSKETMIVTLKNSALFVVFANLIPVANAISFHYRFYDNYSCDHNSPSQDTYPPIGLDLLLGSENQCLSAPQNGNWTNVELDNPLTTGGLTLTTFCNINCEGAGSSEQYNTHCFIPAPNCFIGSFSVAQTASGVQNSSSTQPSITPISNLSTVTVTQISIGIGSSSPTQLSNTSKSKNSTGTVIGGAIGGVVAIACLIFLPFFLLRRARKRQRISPFGIPELSTHFIPSSTATVINERHPVSLTPIRGQATKMFIRPDHSSRPPIVSSYRSQIHRQEGGRVRFSETEGTLVQLSPLY
ncbi:hypothetical protein GALMADRAFT_138716 [Galerina marginata CBS 339.88]|uniref:Uncharacterized protein n=1 Tax=Galerina marginata (strain CBS 339.88) TaxID=685588 RepID=A0A067T373_GALM3|nr:hypothetical protein GALMADRAFT_138716 [Galerina marginata CBS 339.88]